MFRILVLGLMSMIWSCKSANKVQEVSAEPPKDCITEQIVAFSKNACPKGASVKEYQFQGKSVFVFDKGTCGADMSSTVMDAKCQKLGFLGGIMGNTTINGEDFSKASLVRVVWGEGN